MTTLKTMSIVAIVLAPVAWMVLSDFAIGRNADVIIGWSFIVTAYLLAYGIVGLVIARKNK